MRIPIFISLALILLISSCQKFELAQNSNDFFFVKRNKANIPVKVVGNTASGKIVVWVMGGPALTAINVPDVDSWGWSTLQEDFAIAYYDRRGIGNATGNFSDTTITTANEVKDLEAIVQTILHNYNNPKIYIMNHSYAGLSVSKYLINTSTPIAGWINIDGLATFQPDTLWKLRRNYLINLSDEKIAANENVTYWSDALNFANQNPVFDTQQLQNEFQKTVDDAPGYPPKGLGDLFDPDLIFASSYDPFPTYLSPKWHLVQKGLLDEAEKIDVRPELGSISVPTLICWGRYDDIIPLKIGYDFFDLISTPLAEKKMVIFQNSSHEPFVNERDLFRQEVSDFVMNH